jgi:hypothetical protein
MLVNIEEVFVQSLVGGDQIKLLQVLAAFYTAGPTNHEIVGELFAFLICEFAIEVSVFAIQLSHLIGNV